MSTEIDKAPKAAQALDARAESKERRCSYSRTGVSQD